MEDELRPALRDLAGKAQGKILFLRISGSDLEPNGSLPIARRRSSVT